MDTRRILTSCLASTLLRHEDVSVALDAQILLKESIKEGLACLLNEVNDGGDSGYANLPLVFRQEIAHFAQRQAIAEYAIKHKLQDVLYKLHSESIAPIIIKGTGLAYGLYDKPYLRQRLDTDLLIPFEDVEQCRHTLTQLGYKCENRGAVKYLTGQFEAVRVDDNHFTYRLDVHWRINNRLVVGNSLTYAELLKHSISLPNLCPHARTVCLSHALLIACIHRLACDDPNRLIWIYDIHLLCLKLGTGGLRQCVEIAIKQNILSILCSGLEVSSRLFATQIDAALNREIRNIIDTRPAELSAQLLLRSNNRLHNRYADFRSLKNVGQQLQYIREFLIPPVRAMEQRYGKLSRFRLLLLYPKRLVAGVCKVLFSPIR